jgi:hypothetical protein
MSPLRNGPRGLPVIAPYESSAIRFDGAAGQRLTSVQTAVLQTFTFTLFYKPDAAQSVGGAHLISKMAYYAPVTADIPVALVLSPSLVPAISISKGDDYNYDLTVTADSPATANRWNFVGCSYDGSVLTLLSNDAIKTAAGVVVLSTNTQPYTLGNCALDNGGGTNGVIYRGLAYDARIHNKCASASQLRAIKNGLDWRDGLLVEWWRKDRPALDRRPRS